MFLRLCTKDKRVVGVLIKTVPIRTQNVMAILLAAGRVGVMVMIVASIYIRHTSIRKAGQKKCFPFCARLCSMLWTYIINLPSVKERLWHRDDIELLLLAVFMFWHPYGLIQ